MRIAELLLIGSAVVGMGLAAGRAGAMELDFLQTDPRFSGGEVNPSNPSHQNFWFYDQYKAARNTLQAAGVNVIPVSTLTLSAMTADSDAFYMPAPTNPAATTYPLTDQEISVIQQYVATGRSIIFNLGAGISSAMDNNLLTRLGLTGTQAADTTSGDTNYPLPNQPIVGGTAYGAVGSFDYTGTGYFSSLGSMRSLVDIGDVSVIPYVEKGDLGSHYGAYFFILDRGYLTNWSTEPSSQQNLFMNMVLYATEPYSERYIPTALATPGPGSVLSISIDSVTLPEPAGLLAGVGGMALLLKRQRRGRRILNSEF
jgi:hypothetical protein